MLIQKPEGAEGTEPAAPASPARVDNLICYFEGQFVPLGEIDPPLLEIAPGHAVACHDVARSKEGAR